MIKQIYFQSGQAVQQGQILIQLNTDVEQAQLGRLQAKLKQAEMAYHRTKLLIDSHAISRAEMDTALADRDMTRAEIQQLQASIKQKTIRAPFSGVMGIRQVHQGQYLEAGTGIANLVDFRQILANFTLDEQLASRLKIGQSVQLKIDAFPEKSFTAVLKPGMYAKLDIQESERPSLVVPETAITYTAYGNTVFLAKQDHNKLIVQRVAVVLVSSVEGIDYLSSSTVQGRSAVTLRMQLNRDSTQALTEVMAKVNQVRYKLPEQAFDPVIERSSGESTDVAYIGFSSEQLSLAELTDYLSRVVEPMLSTIDGVAKVQTYGSQRLAMRIWLDTDRLASRGVTAADVANAIRQNNYQAAPGQVKGELVVSNVNVSTDLTSIQDFKNLVIRNDAQNLIRLQDVATVELGAASTETSASMDGSLRSVLIPVVTIPLSMLGALGLMLLCGFSINLLTLLAMVLAIGLVVDDAIVVVENVHRHIEEGASPVAAALIGAREVAGPVIAMTITLAAVLPLLYQLPQKELAPNEDQASVLAAIKAPQHANLNYAEHFNQKLDEIFWTFPETSTTWIINGTDGPASSFGGTTLSTWSERVHSADEIQQQLQAKVGDVEGSSIFVFQNPALPGSTGGLPLQMVLRSAQDYSTIYQAMQNIKQKARESGLFVVVDSDLDFNNPVIRIEVDRAKANSLGIRMQDIGEALATLVGENYINRFSMQGRAYDVIPQSINTQRLTAQALTRQFIRTDQGTLIPLSTVAIPAAGVSLGQALSFLEQAASELPTGFSYDWQADARQYVQEVNIYTQIGLVTLIGLISLDRRAAILKAAQIRLRPILMTTAAMVFGLIPLLFATGAGAHSRFGLGLVIVCVCWLVNTIKTFTLAVYKSYNRLTNRRKNHDVEWAEQPACCCLSFCV
ncbi:unnamed protein product [Oppiella nova]|uniref:Uncharacterized protein n=1 Tax=Oppiella nova TaxID=334625 RepID=A0A7R9LFW1_9ACAR|nr:unnamed protein product [Oppiella nova]CAG2162490.1 unnamed protein product [Oppiella nova]